MTKLFGMLFIIALSFGAGYYLRGNGAASPQKQLIELRDDVVTKTEVLQEGVAAARVRINLLEARDRLIQAEKDLIEKNFGKAEQELSIAEDRLAKAILLAKDARRKPLMHRLEPISVSLRETRGDVRRLNPQAKGKVASLERELGRVID